MKKPFIFVLLALVLLAGCAPQAGPVQSLPAEAQSAPAPQSAPDVAEQAETRETVGEAGDAGYAVPAGAVVYQGVELLHYTGEGAHPYVHRVVTNNTDLAVLESHMAMLAFDAEGKPLKIDWNSLASSSEPAFGFLCTWNSIEIEPGGTFDEHGGWSLDFWGDDPEADRIAYVLYCDKQITFEDGTVWENPDYEGWLARYEGKEVDVAELEGYYPFAQQITFA